MSPEKIADNLNTDADDVKKYIATLEKKKAPAWFYVVLVLIPVLFFVLLEVILRVADYGHDYTQWVKLSDKYILNADIAHRYFYSTKDIPYSSKDVFDIEKKENAYRVFVLGGSSAAGFPFAPNGSFPKYIRKRLELLYPDKNIEVVNISMAAVNSYTIRDLLPGVLEQAPDLILIYAGHNEYYGALGVGSLESFGNSRALVNLMLSLKDYKTVQFLRDIIKWGYSLFSDGGKQGGTLMSRMAKEQTIPYNSDTYKEGLEQFRGNMDDVLGMISNAGVPVIFGTLTCNLRDRAPFISVDEANYPPASEVYAEAEEALSAGSVHAADSLFRFARDLDALRFRAPEDINRIIYELGKKYNIQVAEIDRRLAAISPYGITGAERMTDHLHPDLRGYQYIGKFFFETADSLGLFPSRSENAPGYAEQDSMVLANFDYTHLDSVIAAYRLIILKGDWPYRDKKISLEETLRRFNVQTYTDSLALKVIDDKMNWEKAHRLLAQRYIQTGNADAFIREMEVVIDQFPIIHDYYKVTAEGLIQLKEFDKAYSYLEKKYSLKKDAFAAKWMGIIDLNRGNMDKAEKYLNESIRLNGTDAQALYNLAGVYTSRQEYERALNLVERSLRAQPGYPPAKELQNRLRRAINR